MQTNFPVDGEYPEPEGGPVSYGPDVPEPSVPEEMLMHPDRDEDRNGDYENWSEEEIPKYKREEILAKVPKAVRQSVRRAHQGLGHLSRATFLKILRVARTTSAAITYAKVWVYPTFEASAPPHKPLVASTRMRPFGFNMCGDGFEVP